MSESEGAEIEKEDQPRCSTCDKPNTDTALFHILLPPLITERGTYLCRPCLMVAIDNSKKMKMKREAP
jgi:hypothetical protein